MQIQNYGTESRNREEGEDKDGIAQLRKLVIDLMWRMKKEKLRSPNNSQVSEFGIKRISAIYCAKTNSDVGDSAINQTEQLPIFIEILFQ